MLHDDPTPDDIENDPELQDILDDIEDEIFLIQEDELENDEFLDDDDDLDDNEELDFESPFFPRRGQWDDDDDF